jgi:hypothetical protein
MLNAYCALRLSLRASLAQDVYTFMLSKLSIGFGMRLCAPATCNPLAHEIRSTEKSCSLSVSYFYNFFRVARFFESMVITSKLFVAHMSLGEATR